MSGSDTIRGTKGFRDGVMVSGAVNDVRDGPDPPGRRPSPAG
jgi:hypothetical protein